MSKCVFKDVLLESRRATIYSLSLSDTWYAISSVLSIGQCDCNEQELCYYDS